MIADDEVIVGHSLIIKYKLTLTFCELWQFCELWKVNILMFYCSPDDRAALYIQVYTQTEEILTGEVV